jgi:4-hydroxy-tetrahydrodipicolinate reductase
MEKIGIILGGAEGKMGHVIRNLASKADDFGGIHLMDKSYKDFSLDGNIELLKDNRKLDHPGTVYIDATEPGAVIDNIKKMSEAGVDSVVVTTGWYNDIDTVRDIAKANGRRILYASNFSIGVNALYAVTEYLTKTLGPLGFDAAVLELHHTEKKDSPSGTGVELGKIITKNMPGKKGAAYERRGKRPDDEIDVLGARAGSVTGYHMVVFSPGTEDYERLTIEHNASNRNTFGVGVLEGARWMYRSGRDGLEPGLYNFKSDVLKL